MFLGTEWYYLRMQLYGGWSSASGDPLTVLPALGLVFLIVSVALFLNASGRFEFPAPLPRAKILLVSLAILATVSTGWVLTGEFITPAASWWDDYGFPLALRVVSMNGCPPWCNLPRSTTIFNPFFFAIDFCFFTAIGYGVTLTHRRIARQLAQSLGVLSAGRRFLADHRRMGTKVLAVALMFIAGLTIVDSALLWARAEYTSACAGSCPVGRLSWGSFSVNSHTSATFNLSNTRSTSINLTHYRVTMQNLAGTSTYDSTGWSGLRILPGTNVQLIILVDGSAVVFYWGGVYTVEVFSDQDESWVFSTGTLGPNMVFTSLNSPTSLTLNVTNTGPGWINLTAYTVQYGNNWSNNTNWAGPKVGPGMVLPGGIIIDGQAFTFQAGTMYTIRLFDTTGTEWTNYITA